MRKTVIGEVTSAASSKTIKVMVPRTVKHPLYGKYLKRRTVYHAHDEQGDAKLGDMVELVSCRPRSKIKRWELLRVVMQDTADGEA